ncbi:hypothetical protein [Cetobacterium sp. SF1]|uniref:hypothetical protein n=1 Tax=unclassified Cetobacterium TaxID=2630983 RepID=UPI003CF1A459
MKKKLWILPLFFLFFGCSAIMHRIGESDIEDGIAIYQKRGLTTDGFRELTSGLEYAPDSLRGIENLNIQYKQLLDQTNRLLKQKTYTVADLNALKLYLYGSDRYIALEKKIPQLSLDNNILYNNKIKIGKVFENYVLNQNYQGLSRRSKIDKIFYFKSLITYIPNNKIRQVITQLEQEVSINLYLTSNGRNGYSPIDIQNILVGVADRYKNRDLGNYIYFKGYNYYNQYYGNNSYLVDVSFYRFETPLLELSERKEQIGNKIIISQKKKLILTGEYKVINPRTYKVIDVRPINIEQNYTVEMTKTDNTITFSNENDILRKILEDKFSDILLYNLKNIRNLN